MEKEFCGRVKLNSDFEVKNTEYKDAVSLKTFSYTSWLDDADAIINFSKLKTHAMMGMSCAVKNMFGAVPGAVKPEYHMRYPSESSFANVMIDLNEFFKPALYIVDAIDGMEGNGPTAGEKRHVGLILASKKPYALDMVCADIIGLGINDVPTLRAAYDRGLGPRSADEAVTVGCTLATLHVADFKHATIHQSITFEGGGPFNELKALAVKLVFNSRPQVDRAECISCKKCYETCPAKAIKMTVTAANGKKKQIPKIDRSKCIKCFCCQEFCPVGAMKVHKNPLGKFIRSLSS